LVEKYSEKNYFSENLIQIRQKRLQADAKFSMNAKFFQKKGQPEKNPKLVSWFLGYVWDKIRFWTAQ
jgi:hypothetical protein